MTLDIFSKPDGYARSQLPSEKICIDAAAFLDEVESRDDPSLRERPLASLLATNREIIAAEALYAAPKVSRS